MSIGTANIDIDFTGIKKIDFVKTLSFLAMLSPLMVALLPPDRVHWLPQYFHTRFFLLLGVILALVVWICTDLWRSVTIKFGRVDICLSLFGLYLLIRFLTTPESHWSQGSAIWIVSLALSYVVFRRLSRTCDSVILWYGLLLIAVFLITVGLLQLYGILNSYHGLFKMTGTFFNPAPYAGFLSILFPLALAKIIKREVSPWKKNIAWVVCAGILLVVIPSNSRAAWLALGVGCAYLFLSKLNIFSRFRTLRYSARMSAIIVVSLLATAAGWGLYSLKPDSADGRILIWKVASEMVNGAPVFGHGFARFAPEYMLAQGDYFAVGNGTDEEKNLAGQVTFAYNEFIQMAVELGLVGVFLFMLVLYWAIESKRIESSTRQDKVFWRAMLIGWIVFASFSYPMYSWSITILLLLILSQLNAGIRYSFKSKTTVKYFVVLPVLIAGTYLCVWGAKMYLPVQVWRDAMERYDRGDYQMASSMYNDGFESLAYEGIFLQQAAKTLQQLGEYDASNKVLSWSKKYYNDPFTYSMIGENFTALKKYDHAEEAYDCSWNMVPHRIWPRYLLVKMLYQKGDRQRCRELATILSNEVVKIPSYAQQEIFEELRVYQYIK